MDWNDHMPGLLSGHKCLIFGCGYLGTRVARRWHNAGARVTIVTRSAAKAEPFRNQGYQALVADITRPETLCGLPEAKIVLYSVGFDHSAHNTIHQVITDGMSHVLSKLPIAATGRLIYISTTGVYAPVKGAPVKGAPVEGPKARQGWVDEHWPTQPHRPGAQASLATERLLAGHPIGRRAVILRMAGLYGPGRIAYQKKIRTGQPLAIPQEGWLNLIHVDDGASAVLAARNWSTSLSQGPEFFNVSDGQPVVRGDYYREVARLIRAPAPRFTTPDASLPATERAGTSKRISNRKLCKTLGVKLAYPSYREGLAAILG
jgi:nucleoside-diphosphate-sugar epimerase